jgi:hypothetical protein
MIMLIEILNKIFYILFFLSSLNVIRTVFFLIGSFIKSDDEQPQKFRLSSMQLLLLGLSIAYIITSLFTGVEIML